MRWQVLSGIAALGLLAVSPVSATVLDFATDPNLATDWTQYYFYNAYGRNQVAAAWNASKQNLDLTATNEEGLGGLFKTGDVRSATDGVTVTYSNYVATTPTAAANWTCAGLVVSANATPNIFDGSAWYGLYFQEEYDAVNKSPRYRFSAGKGLNTELGRITLDSIPDKMKLDILREGSEWVFKANGIVIARDSSLAGSALTHSFMYWGGGGSDSLSVSADNFGTVVPEPGTLALVAMGVISLLAYAWRKRR